MSVAGLLNRAIDAIEAHPGTHSIGAIARDPQGDPVKANSPYAVSWDVYGLLLKLSGRDRFTSGSDADLASDLIYQAAAERGHLSATRCNDDEGRNGAMWMLRRALHLHELHGPPTSALLKGSTT